MKIDLTCPVELWHYALPTRQYPVCHLQLFNLTEQTVTSLQVVFACYDAQGALMSRQVERIQAQQGLGRSAFEVTAAIDGGEQAEGLDFSIEKVWFEDGTVWRHTAGNVSEYTSNALPAGRRLDVLRYLAGSDALGYPSDQGAVWMCVCGRPNSAREDTCRRCGRLKRDVFTSFNEAAVETVIFEHENAMEEKARRERAEAQRVAEQREAEALKKRNRRRKITLIVTGSVTALVLTFGVYFHGIPFYHYYTASRQLDNGVYTAARAGFENLAARQGRYSLPIKLDFIGLDIDLLDMRLYYSSEDLAKECTYRQARDTMNTGTITALKTAQDAFDSLGDYRDSRDMSRAARYQRAQRLLAARQYESAIALFGEIADYQDAADQSRAALYQWAQERMDNMDYTAAREKFLSLGSYQDAADKAAMCLYQPAQADMQSGDYLDAIALLEQLDTDFENTADYLKASYYGAANQYFSNEEYETAAEYYLKAGDYLDAYTQATACLYEPAVDLYEQGDYAQAKEMLEKIAGFRNAQELVNDCCRQLAREKAEAGDYAAARELLIAAVSDDEATAMLQEYTYIPAVQLQEAGNLDGAAALLENIPGYQDADERLRQVRYAQAEELLTAGDYAGAIAAFDALGDFANSPEEAKNARYSLAAEVLEQGDYTLAIDYLTDLGDYEGSAEMLQRAHYLLGLQLQEGQDIAAATTQFELAGDYQDARARYDDCVYQLAGEAIKNVDYQTAANYLQNIPGYEDAEALRRQSVYLSAEAKQQEGDLSAAAALFASIPDYQDAADRAAACYDAYYEAVYTAARTAMDAQDYAAAVNALEGMQRENVSEKYADIDDIYNEANYNYANELYAQKKPYEALRYYRNIPDYKDVTEKKLNRICYRILGSWVSAKGIKMEFRDDGTCTIDGKDGYFNVSMYAMSVGTRANDLNQNWQIYSCTDKSLSVINNSNKTQYKLTRVTEE